MIFLIELLNLVELTKGVCICAQFHNGTKNLNDMNMFIMRYLHVFSIWDIFHKILCVAIEPQGLFIVRFCSLPSIPPAH